MIGGGAALALLAFVNPTGATCTDRSTATTVSVSCGTTANKGLLFGGLGAAGVGAALLVRGEQLRSQTAIAATPHGLAVQRRFRF